jgi:hypothetical protein
MPRDTPTPTRCPACHTRAVPRSRSVLAGMLLLLALALAAPAVSLAGGSAGDQQYTDPFSGGSGAGSRTASTSTSAPATTPPQTTTSPSASTTPATPTNATDPATVAAVSSTAGEPTATMASTSPTLPYTGYDAWTAIGFGLTLAAGGAVLRWRVRVRRS